MGLAQPVSHREEAQWEENRVAGGQGSGTIPTVRPKATPVPSLGLVRKMGRLTPKMARFPPALTFRASVLELVIARMGRL